MNSYLEKIAKQLVSKEELRPHQEKGLQKLDESGGVLLHHSTGSGKTKSFLTAIEREQARDKDARALVVAPASLVSNIDKEIKKHGLKIDTKRLDAMSYEKAVNMSDELAKRKYAIAVADEAHKLRNADTKRSKDLGEIISKADKRVLATATANYNHLADLAPLLNIVAGDKVLPTDWKEVERRLTEKRITKPGLIGKLLGKPNKEEVVLRADKGLKKLMEQHVSYYDSREDPAAKSKFPTRTEETVEVPMDNKQLRYYKYVEGNIPFMLRMKIRHNLPLDKKEKANLNAFSTGVRQASNSYRHLDKNKEGDFTPKVQEASKRLLEKLKADKNFKALVYSNFLESGLEEYSKKLKESGVRHSLFTGSLSKAEKDRLMKEYNAGTNKVMLISSSGSEGLDTKGTKLVQILEPHFNKAKIDQVMGRADRFESHAHLPEAERKVHVEHYLSVHPKPFIGKAPYSIDKYLSENSDEKNKLFDQVKDLMKESDK